MGTPRLDVLARLFYLLQGFRQAGIRDLRRAFVQIGLVALGSLLKMSNALLGCRARVERAEQYMVELAEKTASWPGVYVSYEPRYDKRTGWHSWYVKHVAEIPVEFGLLASDYIHQLRSALDNLIAYLAVLNGVQVESSHSFPMVAKAKDWKGAAGSQLKGLRADHVQEIRGVQPFEVSYDAALHPLAVLRRLSNRDKHEMVTPTFASNAGLADIEITKVGISIAGVETTEGHPIVANTDMLRVRTEPADPIPGFVIKDDGPGIYISFGDPPINLEGLDRIGACVYDIVTRPAFES